MDPLDLDARMESANIVTDRGKLILNPNIFDGLNIKVPKTQKDNFHDTINKLKKAATNSADAGSKVKGNLFRTESN